MPVEQPTDFNGVVYAAAADTDLCEIVWIDPPPLDQDELRSLLDRAAEALAWARAACQLQASPRGLRLLALALIANGAVAEAAAVIEQLPDEE